MTGDKDNLEVGPGLQQASEVDPVIYAAIGRAKAIFGQDVVLVIDGVSSDSELEESQTPEQ